MSWSRRLGAAGRGRGSERRLRRDRADSSMPPSTDGRPGKVPPEAGGPGQRPQQGKQPGAPGRQWHRRGPIRWSISPRGVCGCRADLAGTADLGVAPSVQRLEVPLITARRVQHDLHQARCCCGKVPWPPPGGRAGLAGGIGPTLCPGGLPGGVPARTRRAVRAADRGRDRRGGLGRVRALLPGPGGLRSRRCRAADQDADHRRARGWLR